MKLLIAVVMLMASTAAWGQGASYLGMCNPTWDCKAMMDTWDKQGPIITGWVEGTFGASCGCANRLLRDRRDKIVRIHVLNGPCLRNSRCGRYEPFWGYSVAKANRSIRKWKGRLIVRFEQAVANVKRRLKSARGKTTCYVSPCLECDLNETARRLLLHYLSNHLPHCILVDNPNRGACIGGAVCERHGASPHVTEPCIVDMDGSDGRQIDVKKWVEQYRKCDVAYYWEPWMNCASEDFVDPRKRDCKVIHSLFTSVRNLLCRYYFPLLGTC